MVAQRDIITLYKRDITKYDFKDKLQINHIYDLIPPELNEKNKRFILKSLNENAKYDRYHNGFLWLKNAGVAIPVYNVEEPKTSSTMPLLPLNPKPRALSALASVAVSSVFSTSKSFRNALKENMTSTLLQQFPALFIKSISRTAR